MLAPHGDIEGISVYSTLAQTANFCARTHFGLCGNGPSAMGGGGENLSCLGAYYKIRDSHYYDDNTACRPDSAHVRLDRHASAAEFGYPVTAGVYTTYKAVATSPQPALTHPEGLQIVHIHAVVLKYMGELRFLEHLLTGTVSG